MLVGDKVVFTKRITGHKDKDGTIRRIEYTSQGNVLYYNVLYYNEKENLMRDCNVFPHHNDESIEDRVKYYRDLKLKQLGI